MSFEGSNPSPQEVGVNPSHTELEKPKGVQEVVGPNVIESLVSVNIFPEKVRHLIEEEINQGQSTLQGFQTLEQLLKDKGGEIQDVLGQEVDETDSFWRMIKYANLSEYFEQLKQLQVPYIDFDLCCRELMELRAKLLEARARCRGLLGESTDSLAPDHLEASISELRDRILVEELEINGENIASHVTGYLGLVKILQSGSLASRAVQSKSGEGISTFKGKGRSEEHQIVFDMRTIRSSYARGKDKKGREDPIIIMMRSRDLMTQYQYLDSDGRHFFGATHDLGEGVVDPFRCDISSDNAVVLVPEIYRDDVVSDLTETANSMGISVEQLLEKRGVVFIKPEQYTVETGVFAGKVFSGIQSSGEIGENDRKIVHGLLEIGRQKLYSSKLPRIRGRIVPTGNICEGAGGVEGKAYIFTTLKEKK